VRDVRLLDDPELRSGAARLSRGGAERVVGVRAGALARVRGAGALAPGAARGLACGRLMLGRGAGALRNPLFDGAGRAAGTLARVRSRTAAVRSLLRERSVTLAGAAFRDALEMPAVSGRAAGRAVVPAPASRGRKRTASLLLRRSSRRGVPLRSTTRAAASPPLRSGRDVVAARSRGRNRIASSPALSEVRAARRVRSAESRDLALRLDAKPSLTSSVRTEFPVSPRKPARLRVTAVASRGGTR
jgi:hypothetical protein